MGRDSGEMSFLVRISRQCIVRKSGDCDLRQTVHLHELSSFFAIPPRMGSGQRQRWGEFALADGVAHLSTRLAAWDAGAGPRLRTGRVIDLSPLPVVSRGTA